MSKEKAKERVLRAAIRWAKAINHLGDLKKITDAQNSLSRAVAALEKEMKKK